MSEIMSILFNIFRTLRTKIAHGPILGKKEEGEKKKKSNKIFPKYICMWYGKGIINQMLGPNIKYPKNSEREKKKKFFF